MPAGPQVLFNGLGEGPALRLNLGGSRTKLLSGAGPAGGHPQGRTSRTKSRDHRRSNVHR